MITLNTFLFWAILSVVFMAGFLTCSLVCVNDLKQPDNEAENDESHSATRYKEGPK